VESDLNYGELSMARGLLIVAVALHAMAWSSVTFAAGPHTDSGKLELREIKRLLLEINARVQRLEERIAAEDQEAAGNDVNDSDLMWQLFGVRLAEIGSKDSRWLGGQFRGGMRIVSISSDGPAAAHGLREGDVIVGMQTWVTEKRHHVNFVLSSDAVRATEPVNLYVLRDRETLVARIAPQR
jgi:hypothetical protein